MAVVSSPLTFRTNPDGSTTAIFDDRGDHESAYISARGGRSYEFRYGDQDVTVDADHLVIYAGESNTGISGGAADISFVGGGGASMVYGGDGDDTLAVTYVPNSYEGDFSNGLSGGGGRNTARVDFSAVGSADFFNVTQQAYGLYADAHDRDPSSGIEHGLGYVQVDPNFSLVTLIGGAGDDSFALSTDAALSGEAIAIDAGAGFDMVSYDTSRANVHFSRTAQGAISVTLADGRVDLLTNVEQIVFDDAVVDTSTIGADPPTLTAATPTGLVEAGLLGPGTDRSTVALTLGGGAATFDLAGWTATAAAGVYTRAATYGTATLDTNSDTLSYQLDNGRAATDGLKQGASAEDDFILTVSNVDGSAQTSVHFMITGANDGPAASAHGVTVVYGRASTLTAASLLTGATDPDGDALSLASVGNARHGTVAIDSHGSAVFTPFVGYDGTAAYDYTISDGHGGTATARVDLAVQGTTPAYIYHGTATNAETADFTGDTARHQFVAGSGATTIYGGDGGGSFRLGAGTDVFIGGTGRDQVTFGSGVGTVTGGAGGLNTFVFVKGQIADGSASGQYDTITDFHLSRRGYAPDHDFLYLSGFTRNATISYEHDIVGSPDRHLYRVDDGAYHAEFVLGYAGAAIPLTPGQWGFI